MKRIYYHPGTGEPTCLLPADKYHEALFLRQGFTLEPPESIEEPQVEQTMIVKPARKRARKNKNGKSICKICGKQYKNVRLHMKVAHTNIGG